MRRTNGCGNNSWSQIASGITSTTYIDTTASSGTTYGYYIIAVNGCGTAGDKANCGSGSHSLSTPTAPTGFTANGSCTAIDLSWGAVTGATSYNILRTTNSNCSTGLSQIGTSATTTYSDTTATAGTTYYYVVQAVNSCGTSGNSNCANSVRSSTPTAPTGLTANGSCTAIDLSWGAVTGATSYNILRTTNSNCSTGLSQIGTSATTTYSDTTATAGTTYYYVVQAVNSCGTSGNSNCANSVRSSTPTAPTGLTANGSCTAIDLSWSAVTGATSYNILRTTNSNCSTGLAQIGTSATTTYSDTTATVGTTYYYVVQAVNACGTSTNSNCANSSRVITPSAPSAPTVADISNCSLSGVSISWGSVPNATGYDLYVDGITLIQNVTTPHTYTPGDSSSHSYQIRAKNGSCIGSWSGATSQVDQNLTPTPTISGNSTNICPDTYVTLVTENGMSNYQWYLNGSPIGGATSYQYSATQSGNYTVSYTSSGCPGTSSSKSVTINPCIPNIVYSTNLSPQPVNEDGDGVMEAGEKWSMQVTVINNGNAPAINVVGSLSGEEIDVCNNPANFGDIANGATKSYTFEFVVNSSLWYSTYPCGSSIGFDLINKSSTGYTYTDDTNFYSHQVGNVGGTTTETATALDQTNIKNKTVTVSLTPSFTLQPTIDSATLSFSLSGSVDVTSCVMVRLVSPTTQYLLLKDYGQSIASPYNVTSFYNTYGAGTYRLEITESSSCGTASQSANCTGISMSVTVGGGTTNCDTWNATCSGCLNPSAPSIDSITDNDSCSQSGVTITFTEGTPATRHDLYVDGSVAVSDVTSPIVYDPQNTLSHAYKIRAVNISDSCFTDSIASSYADTNNSPGAPTITAVNDVDACAQSGIQVVFTSGSGATSHDLYKDGNLAVTGYVSGATYNPSDTASHNYVVKAIKGTCSTDSNTMAGTDASGTPSQPVITSIVDIDPNNLTGIQVHYNPGSPAIQHDLYRNGIIAVSDYASGATYLPGDNGTYSYVVRAVNGTCAADSTAVSGTDAYASTPPPEIATGTNYTWPTVNQTQQTMGWNTEATATGYRVYRGTLANLGNLCNTGTDFCTRYDGTNTTLDITSDNPATIDSTNKVIYYLIVAYNAGGEGPSGTATCGARVVNTTGNCP
jgi:fibronectin type 3 domain-containing protein